MKHVLTLTLFVFLAGAFAHAQQKVTGTITGADDGNPIPFATVSVKGFSQAVASSSDKGTYTINVPKGGTTLIFNFFGMKTKEVEIGNQSTIDVALENEVQALEETIVVAYGTVKKSTFTGSASTVRASLINDIPQTSFENAMAGTVAGLQLSPTSGQVGSSVSIRIRGTGSLNASNDPLYVIDGVPVISGDVSTLDYSSNNVMNTINPNDIASITVLKDAAASSLYGSRAANGIVVITTKSGRKEKMSVNFKANYGFTPTFAYNNMEKASSEDQVAYTKDLYRVWASQAKNADGSLRYPTDADQRAKAEADFNANIGNDPRGFFDWYDALFKTAVLQNYDLSASGGSDKTTYFASFGYTKEEGRVRPNNLSRWNGRLNVSQKLFNFSELTSNILFSSVDKKGFNDTYNNGANYFLMERNLLFNNWWPTNVDGSWHTGAWRTYAQNVIYYDNFRESVSGINRLSANNSLRINFTDELIFKTIFSYDETRVNDFTWRAPIHYEALATNGRVSNTNYKILRLVNSNTLNWNHTFAEKHVVGLLVGLETEKHTTNYLQGIGTNLPTLDAKVISVAGKTEAWGSTYGNSMISMLSRLDYNYQGKYYLSGSFRSDGSSKFRPVTRWGNFWSASGAWRIKEEPFLKQVDWLSNLFFKVSYGTNGTLPSENYAAHSLFTYGYPYSYNANVGGAITSFADDNLTWETNYNTNIGINSAFFNNRLTFNIEFYNRDSRNLLQDVPNSTITGIGTILRNVGEMNNRGVEIEVGGDIIRSKELTWSLSINGATLRSRVTKLYRSNANIPEDIIKYDPTGGDSRARFILREGYSPKSFYGKEWAGVDPSNGEPMWYINNPNYTGTVYKDLNGRPVTNKWASASDAITGSADPKIFGGINTNVRWKGFLLDLNFVYSLGGDAFSASERYMNDDGYFTSRTRTVKAMDYWKKEGDITQGPRLGLAESEIFNTHQSRWLYRNNFIRLKIVTLSYNLPKSIVEKIKMSNCRVYFNGTNLLTFASQNEFDPEVNVWGTRGWEMPLGKTYTFGLELTF